jgi:chromosome segregation ATPase
MKYKRLTIINIGLILFVSSLCFAEFYKYKDSNGFLRFTDNLAEVADKYKEYVSEKVDSKEELKQAIENTEKKLPGAPPETKELQIQVLGNKIKKIREDLHKEYQQLVAKKKSIEMLDQKKGPKNSKQIQYLNDQAEQLNKDIKTYNQKKETFVEAIKEYQKQIQMLSAKREIPAQ